MSDHGGEESEQEFGEQQTGEWTPGRRHDSEEPGIFRAPRNRVSFGLPSLPRSSLYRQPIERPRPRRSTADYDPSANVSPYGDNFFAVNDLSENDRASYRNPSEATTESGEKDLLDESNASTDGEEDEAGFHERPSAEGKAPSNVAAIDLGDDSDEDMPSFEMKLATYTKSIAGQPFDPEAQIKEEDLGDQRIPQDNSLPMQLLQRPSDIFALYQLLDNMDVLMILIEEHDWEFANQEPESADELYKMDATACDYLEEMLTYWNNPPEYPTLTTPQLAQSGMQVVMELWDEQPEQEELLVALRKTYAERWQGQEQGATAVEEGSQDNVEGGIATVEPVTSTEAPEHDVVLDNVDAVLDNLPDDLTAVEGLALAHETGLETIEVIKNKGLEGMSKDLQEVGKMFVPSKISNKVKVILSDKATEVVDIDSSGKAVSSKPKRILPEALRKVVKAFADALKDPAYSASGKLIKKTLKQHPIIGQHVSKRGDISHGSDLRKYTPEELGFTEEMFNYLSNNTRHHAKYVIDGVSRVDGSPRKYKRNQCQKRGADGKFGAKTSVIDKSGVFNPFTPGLHPLNAQYSLMMAIGNEHIDASDFGMKRGSAKFTNLRESAVALINRCILIERWANQEREKLSAYVAGKQNEILRQKFIMSAQKKRIADITEWCDQQGLKLPDELTTEIASPKTTKRYAIALDDKRLGENRAKPPAGAKQVKTPKGKPAPRKRKKTATDPTDLPSAEDNLGQETVDEEARPRKKARTTKPKVAGGARKAASDKAAKKKPGAASSRKKPFIADDEGDDSDDGIDRVALAVAALKARKEAALKAGVADTGLITN